MARWDYEISEETARFLRNAIRDEDCGAICVALQQAYQEINEMCPEYYDEYDLQNDLEDLDYIDCDVEGAEDEINYELSEFYDLCDTLRIWVPFSYGI